MMKKLLLAAGCFLTFQFFAAAAAETGSRTGIKELEKKYSAEIRQMSSRFLEDRESAVAKIVSKAEQDTEGVLNLMTHLLADENWHVQSSAASVLKQMGDKTEAVRDEIAELLINAVLNSDWGLFSLTEDIFRKCGGTDRETVRLITRKADRIEGNMGRSLQQFIERLKAGKNDPPELQAETYEAVEGEPCLFSVKVRDSDDISCFLKAEIIQQPGQGKLTAKGPREFTFTPPLGYTGELSFTCRASDYSGTESAPCTMTIQVKPDTAAPEINQVLAAGIATQLLVSFSKPMNPESAADISLYSIEPGITIHKAIPDKDPEKVKLIISDMKENVKYTLTVKGVNDASHTGNPCRDSETFSFSSSSPGLMCALYKPDGRHLNVPEDFNALKPVKQGVVKQLRLTLVHSKFDENGIAIIQGEWKRDHADTYFAAKFDGFLAIAKEGDYTFHVKADDSGILYIDRNNVASNGKQGTVKLKPGLHRLCLTYSQGTWAYGLKVEYEGPGIKLQEIPDTVLLNAGDGSKDAGPVGEKKNQQSGCQNGIAEEFSEDDFAGNG